MSNHRQCCCADDDCFPIEEYLNTAHGIGCSVGAGEDPTVSYGCCGGSGCQQVHCGDGWSFSLEVMLQRVSKDCAWGEGWQATSGCDQGQDCGSAGTVMPSYCCCDECAHGTLTCATIYDTQVVSVATDDGNWTKEGHDYIQDVVYQFGPYDPQLICCMQPDGASLAEACENVGCTDAYDCEQPENTKYPGPIENGIIADNSTARVNMDAEGLTLTFSFRMELRATGATCTLDRVVGPHGFNFDGSYVTDYDLWIRDEGSGGEYQRGVLLPLLWGADVFRCYCSNSHNVEGTALVWDTPEQIGFAPLNGEDYTVSGGFYGLHAPVYYTRHHRCYVSGPTYEGRCGNCGPWSEVRCWLGEMYET